MAKFYIFCYNAEFSLIIFILIGLTKGGHIFSGNILSMLYLSIGIYCMSKEHLTQNDQTKKKIWSF